MSYQNVSDLVKKIVNDFPNLITTIDIGFTYQENLLQVIEFNYVNSTNTNKKGVLITGAHHSRELTSISMNLYLIMKICYGIVNQDPETMLMLNNTNLYFIPVVNIDGFKHISEVYDST